MDTWCPVVLYMLIITMCDSHYDVKGIVEVDIKVELYTHYNVKSIVKMDIETEWHHFSMSHLYSWTQKNKGTWAHDAMG